MQSNVPHTYPDHRTDSMFWSKCVQLFTAVSDTKPK